MGRHEMQAARGRVLQEAAGALVVGDGVKVIKGSKALGIEKGWGGRVRAITPGERGAGKLEIYFRDGQTRVLWVRHLNRLADAEFSVNRGDPTQAVTLARIPAGQPVPGFTTAKTPAAAPTETRHFGFREELSAALVMVKLSGHNFIDDGGLLEADGADPAAVVRAQLGKVDGLALAIRRDLNGLVREGVELLAAAAELAPGSDAAGVMQLKPVLGRLLTAYAELVAGLQKAREGVGYEVAGPSVTTLGTAEDVGARVAAAFGQHAPGRYMPEGAADGDVK